MTKLLKNNLQVAGTGTDFLASEGKVLVARVSVGQVKNKKHHQKIFLQVAVARNQEKNCTDELRTRTAFQQFIKKTPRSTFKKLIVSMPGLYKVYIQ
jgi:hypothetical protein